MATSGIPIDGNRLRISRRRARMTQEHVARTVGCSPNHVMRLETNRQSPGPELLDRLIALLGDDFVTDETRAIYIPAEVAK